MALLASILLSFIPAFIFVFMIYWIDRYEKEPKLLITGAFLWGAIVAAGGAYIMNTVFGISIYLLTANEVVADIATGSFSAPFFEESLKAIAVLIVFFVFRKEFDSVLDGIVYASVAALGFAATENVLYLYEHGYATDGWGGLWTIFVIRVVLGPWNHPFYTAFTGIGLAIARLNKSTLVKLAAPLAGWGLAMFTHFLHNTMAVFVSGLGGLALIYFVDWIGWLFMIGIILWAVWGEKKRIEKYMREELDMGVITAKQFSVASSAWRRSMAVFGALAGGKLRNTQKFYHACAELAHKKYQFERLGEGRGQSTAMIEKLRAELAQLSPKAGV